MVHIKFQSEIDTYMYAVRDFCSPTTRDLLQCINEHKTLTLHATDKRKEGGRREEGEEEEGGRKGKRRGGKKEGERTEEMN